MKTFPKERSHTIDSTEEFRENLFRPYTRIEEMSMKKQRS